MSKFNVTLWTPVCAYANGTAVAYGACFKLTYTPRGNTQPADFYVTVQEPIIGPLEWHVVRDHLATSLGQAAQQAVLTEWFKVRKEYAARVPVSQNAAHAAGKAFAFDDSRIIEPSQWREARRERNAGLELAYGQDVRAAFSVAYTQELRAIAKARGIGDPFARPPVKTDADRREEYLASIEGAALPINFPEMLPAAVEYHGPHFRVAFQDGDLAYLDSFNGIWFDAGKGGRVSHGPGWRLWERVRLADNSAPYYLRPVTR